MKNPGLFYGAIVIAIIGLLLAIFYAIPGISHPLTTGNPLAAHYKHVALFAVIAILGVVGALVSRPKASASN
ncbi:MAG TPA: hypothetical protein VGN34_26625 [Ktedonobacteraceae bacterium]|jgi:cytochrome b561